MAFIATRRPLLYKPPVAAAGGSGHTYWRIEITAAVPGGDGGSNLLDFFEAEFLASGVDLATGGTASASETNGGFVASNAFDDNGGTRWISNTTAFGTKWLQYQFASPVTPDQISITPFSSGRTPGTFTVKFSDDGSSFTLYGSSSFSTIEADWTAGVKKTFTLVP